MPTSYLFEECPENLRRVWEELAESSPFYFQNGMIVSAKKHQTSFTTVNPKFSNFTTSKKLCAFKNFGAGVLEILFSPKPTYAK